MALTHPGIFVTFSLNFYQSIKRPINLPSQSISQSIHSIINITLLSFLFLFRFINYPLSVLHDGNIQSLIPDRLLLPASSQVHARRTHSREIGWPGVRAYLLYCALSRSVPRMLHWSLLIMKPIFSTANATRFLSWSRARTFRTPFG